MTPVFRQFAVNISYAHNLITGGRALEGLQSVTTSAFGDLNAADPADLYRAAWSQAVAALDHWLHEEIIERAVELTDDGSNARPKKLNALKMPWSMVERSHKEEIRTVFREFLEDELRFRSFHSTESITQGIQLVNHWSPSQIWNRVGQLRGMTAEAVKFRHDKEVIMRRNDIAHRADLAPVHGRQPMAADDAKDAVDWINKLAEALTVVLDS
ncbi:hypothetical protein [Actinoallomurus sp. CA-150999]|uniref:hypothetical protein n=1 Tax=Actinoallomurus sp. CA-150999 TaxID=3239887 RepID=UPI003D8E4BD9